MTNHKPELVSVYDYGDTVISEGDLFNKSAANAEFDGYTVHIHQFGLAVMLMVEEPEPKLRKIWHIFCCERHASKMVQALAVVNDGRIE